MSDTASNNSFYRPQVRELGFAACCVLEKAGGQLSIDRTEEVVGDFMEIPETERNLAREDAPQETEFAYCLAWACSELRSKGFMARNQSGSWGECILTEAGHELGRWACRVYDGDNPELPDWVQAFLRPTFNRMVNLLKGGKRQKPPDYELCRWVRYCYLRSRAALGVAIFNLILTDHVAARLYKQAERQARILKLRVKESEQRQLDKLLAVGQTNNGADNNGVDQMRQLVLDNTPPGTRVRPNNPTCGWNSQRHPLEETNEPRMDARPSPEASSFSVGNL